MDKEEAISYLETMKMIPKENWNELWKEVAEKRNQVIDIAIEALQVKIDDDLISRQDTFNLLMQRARELEGLKGDLGGACNGAAKLVKKLPSADRLSGQWAPPYADVPTNCSICGEDWDKYVYGSEVWYTGELPKFCPNCGVRMKLR